MDEGGGVQSFEVFIVDDVISSCSGKLSKGEVYNRVKKLIGETLVGVLDISLFKPQGSFNLGNKSYAVFSYGQQGFSRIFIYDGEKLFPSMGASKINWKDTKGGKPCLKYKLAVDGNWKFVDENLNEIN